MTKVTKAVHDRAEAQSLRSTADGIDAASPPDPLAARFMRDDAAVLELSAIDALTLDTPPPVGAGGELVPTGDQIKHGGGNFIDTVERPDAITATASMDRLKLADEIQCVPLAVDTAETIQAKNSIEKMMAHQLAAAHKLAMTFAAKAKRLIEEDENSWYVKPTVYATEASRVANASARMMDAFQKGALALHKLRTGGTQTVTVQHVNVSDGGKAVVTGGINAGGGDET
jgi:hypothetical protein